MQSKLVTFDSLDVGERFFDPNTAEDYSKVCGNAGEYLIGGNYHSGQLATFEPNELVQPLWGNQ
jgi:hypothetical protein